MSRCKQYIFALFRALEKEDIIRNVVLLSVVIGGSKEYVLQKGTFIRSCSSCPTAVVILQLSYSSCPTAVVLQQLYSLYRKYLKCLVIAMRIVNCGKTTNYPVLLYRNLDTSQALAKLGSWVKYRMANSWSSSTQGRFLFTYAHWIYIILICN